MRHLTDGALRRLIDEPLAVSEPDSRHLAECSECQARSSVTADNAIASAALLRVAEPSSDVGVALAAVRGRLSVAPAHRRAVARWGFSFQPLMRPGLVAAAMLLVASLGVAATPSLVTIFQPHQVTAVPVSAPDHALFAGLPNLDKYGTIEVIKRGENSTVLTAAEARQLSGLTLPVPPAEYAGRPATYQVIGRSEASFTFSADKARAAAAAAGKPAPNFSKVPGIDGTRLTVSIGPAVAVVYGTVDKNTDLNSLPLIIGVSEPPLVKSTGASLKELEDFLISQPGIAGNNDLIAQIKAIGDPLAAGNLVIPVPVGMATSQPISLNGNTAGVMITEKTNLVRAVVWEKKVKDSTGSDQFRVYAVAGHFDAEQIQSLASRLDR